MSKHKLIPYPVIAAAVRGDPEAVNQCAGSLFRLHSGSVHAQRV